MKKEEGKSLVYQAIITLRRHFLTGVLTTVPLAAAILLLVWIFINIDNVLQPIIKVIFGREIVGVGFGVTVVLIYIVGVIASNVLGRRIVRFGESLVTRIPVFRPLYFSIKQVSEGLAGTSLKQSAFREVILVEFPRKGMRTIAFVTNELTDESGEKIFFIFVPTSPLPTSGYFEIVTEDMIIHTNISVDEAMKMVISGGMISPTKIDIRGVSKS